jgi:hypothetical protein
LARLPAAIHSGLVTAVSDSLHVVFLTAVPVLVVAFLITLFLREIPLGHRAHAPSAVAEGMGLDEAAEVVVASLPSVTDAASAAVLAGTRQSDDRGTSQ